MTPERVARFRAMLAKRQPDLTLVTEQVHKSRNLAALIRNCDAVGIGEIHCVAPKTGYERYSGTAKGSDRYVNVLPYDSYEDALLAVKAQGKKIVSAHFSTRAVHYRSVDYTQPCALLMGAEKQGVSDLAAEMADEHVIIPMMGLVSSLNVSTAAGIIMAEAMEQRLQAGCYDQQQLTEEEVSQRIFEWGYPSIAKYCRLHGFAYPLLDDNAQIISEGAWLDLARQGAVPTYDWSQVQAQINLVD